VVCIGEVLYLQLHPTKIYSTGNAFAAVKADGSITAWGYSDDGGTGAPSDNRIRGRYPLK
jgi:hypothetical protein